MSTSRQTTKRKQTKLLSFRSIEKHIFNKFHKSYFIDELYYGARVINDIIYNEKTHIVATFKDYLILDDVSEFLKRYYTTIESNIRLPKFFEYYETYSRIYPNYTSLPESRYTYKNIHKKQKMIDQQQDLEVSVDERRTKKEKEIDVQVFSTDVCNSIANDSSYMEMLFGIDKKRKNSDSENSYNNTRVMIENSLEGVNTIISKIDKIEKVFEVKQPIRISGKIFNNCTKKMTKHNKEMSSVVTNSKLLFKNMNLFSELKLGNNISNNNSVVSQTHRKTMSSNTSKIKNNQNIFPLTHRCFNQDKYTINEYDKIKVNVNYLNKGSESDRSKHKTKHNLNTHNRNHNCLLNSKGQIYSSKTNNNSGSYNTNSSIRNPSATINKQIKKTIPCGYKTDRLKTDRPKSTFDFAFLHNLISKSISKSKSKNKHIGSSNNASTLNTTRNKSKGNKLNYGTNLTAGYTMTKPKKISVNILGKEESKNAFMTKIVSPPQKSSVIKGIQIKNFNKALGLNDYLSPKLKIDSNNKKGNEKNRKKSSNPSSGRKCQPQTMRVMYKPKI